MYDLRRVSTVIKHVIDSLEKNYRRTDPRHLIADVRTLAFLVSLG